VGMLGWWVGRGDSDQMGHLLRVTPDFCRYVASAYTPRDITSLLPVSASRTAGGAGALTSRRCLLRCRQPQGFVWLGCGFSQEVLA
jgi:hypothetical protein